MQPVKPDMRMFICYTSTDRGWYKKLKNHLSALNDLGITISNNHEIPAGENRKNWIDRHLKEADVILLLVSPDFLASENYGNKEVQFAFERREAGTVRVIPIILKKTDWQRTELGKLQALPSGDKSVTEWKDQHAALHDITQEIRSVVETRRNDHESQKLPPESDLLSTPRKGQGKTVNIGTRTENTYIIGVDIDRSHLTLLLTDRAGKIIAEESPDAFDASAGVQICLQRVANELHTLLTRSHVAWEQVEGIGMATPGPLTRDLRKILSVSQKVFSAPGTVFSASQMPGWEGVDIPATLERKLKKNIPIYLDNDANMGALGESRYGAGRDITDLVAYVKIGIGIGAGLVINGRLYHGNTKAAGELGHIVVKEDGELCPCGNRGCLETVAAEPVIIKDALAGISLRASDPGSTQTPALAEYKGKVDITAVIKAAEDGDKASQIALQRAGEWIGRALGTVINLLNPSMILVDGEKIRENDFLFEALLHAARESSLLATWSDVKITPCKLKKPVVVGAVANVIDLISSDHP